MNKDKIKEDFINSFVEEKWKQEEILSKTNRTSKRIM